jgi:hypothetical protein
MEGMWVLLPCLPVILLLLIRHGSALCATLQACCACAW